MDFGHISTSDQANLFLRKSLMTLVYRVHTVFCFVLFPWMLAQVHRIVWGLPLEQSSGMAAIWNLLLGAWFQLSVREETGRFILQMSEYHHWRKKMWVVKIHSEEKELESQQRVPGTFPMELCLLHTVMDCPSVLICQLSL